MGFSGASEDVVVVKTKFRFGQVFANFGECSEIEATSGDGAALPGRDLVVVGGKEFVGIYLEVVTKDVGGRIAGEVEIGVIGEVDGRGGVGLCGGAPSEGFLADDIFDGYAQVTGVAFFPIVGEVGEIYAVRGGRSGFPYDFVEACDPAVEVVGAIVYGESKFISIKAKFSSGYTVCVAAYGGSEVSLVSEPFITVFSTDEDVSGVAVAVGD